MSVFLCSCYREVKGYIVVYIWIKNGLYRDQRNSHIMLPVSRAERLLLRSSDLGLGLRISE